MGGFSGGNGASGLTGGASPTWGWCCCFSSLGSRSAASGSSSALSNPPVLLKPPGNNLSASSSLLLAELERSGSQAALRTALGNRFVKTASIRSLILEVKHPQPTDLTLFGTTNQILGHF